MTSAAEQLAYLGAAVCFILALKGLSSPRTARRGNLVGAAGARVAADAVFAPDEQVDHPVVHDRAGVEEVLAGPREIGTGA